MKTHPAWQKPCFFFFFFLRSIQSVSVSTVSGTGGECFSKVAAANIMTLFQREVHPGCLHLGWFTWFQQPWRNVYQRPLRLPPRSRGQTAAHLAVSLPRNELNSCVLTHYAGQSVHICPHKWWSAARRCAGAAGHCSTIQSCVHRFALTNVRWDKRVVAAR